MGERVPMEDMLKLDYVTGWSLGEDLRIVLRTILPYGKIRQLLSLFRAASDGGFR
jgi:hypothetical protein